MRTFVHGAFLGFLILLGCISASLGQDTDLISSAEGKTWKVIEYHKLDEDSPIMVSPDFEDLHYVFYEDGSITWYGLANQSIYDIERGDTTSFGSSQWDYEPDRGLVIHVLVELSNGTVRPKAYRTEVKDLTKDQIVLKHEWFEMTLQPLE